MNEFITLFTKSIKTTKPYDYRREAYTIHGLKNPIKKYIFIYYMIFIFPYKWPKL